MSVESHSIEAEDSATAEISTEGLDPLVGFTIDGRFRIVDSVGKGAMGQVYRAVQLPLNRAVAIKLLDSRKGAGRDETFKQRFLVEAALTAKLNHPNTVRVLDYGSTKEGLFYLAMEYLDGETLEKLLKKGPLPWHRVVSIAQQVARSLREAHELGVVHRDLKPGNIVLLHADDDADFVKVLDFGLVKSFVEGHELEGRAITQQGMLLGSPPYMAPEQGERNRSDPRSDIYSLGAILFEMLSGKPPFGDGGGLEVILKHVHEPVPELVTPAQFEAVPTAFANIVHKCLAKSPMDRFQSMDELLAALQDVHPVHANTDDFPAPNVTAVLPALRDEELALPMFKVGNPKALLGLGFLAAAVAGVFGTWAVLRPASPSRLLLQVDSSPSGARVSVDGKFLGVAPLELEQTLGRNVRGSMDLRLEKEGYSPAQVHITSADGKVSLLQKLMPLPPVVVPTELPVPAAPKVEPVKRKPPKHRP